MYFNKEGQEAVMPRVRRLPERATDVNFLNLCRLESETLNGIVIEVYPWCYTSPPMLSATLFAIRSTNRRATSSSCRLVSRILKIFLIPTLTSVLFVIL